ncbi:putative hydrolase of the HAD superfamily [Deinococcus metalli]|uniref:Hydrolase n=1 Tax=Deinococcus metalli TaxID=1141878 RepID=A0A7W8KB04_9DEIO|nr:HAD family hydrolase [Deinococcus metalli]MBB5374786.1 putative hydrolase of the HAD superfamily [Deinococcus metalli]GHF33732.1 hydrolase [Deinococcus metalli]
MTPPQAVILDLDDTLFDDTHCTRAGLRGLTRAHGLTCDPDDVFRRHAAHLRAIDPLLFRGELNAHGARVLRFTRLLTDLGVPGPDGEAATVTYRTAYRAAWTLLDGAAGVLHALRAAGVTTAILTNYVREVQVEKLAHFGLDTLVDAVLCIEDVPAPKPDARSYHAACAALSVAPAQAVMVGDSWTNDVAGARAAGLRAVWLSRTAAPAPEPGVPTVARLADLPAALGLVIA